MSISLNEIMSVLKVLSLGICVRSHGADKPRDQQFYELEEFPYVLKEVIFGLWRSRKRLINPLHQVNLGKCIDS